MRGGLGIEGREGIEKGRRGGILFFCSLFVCFFENKWFVICDVCFFFTASYLESANGWASQLKPPGEPQLAREP